MLKIYAAIGLASALVLAPVPAFADESTTPPKPNTVKTPGSGPDVTPMMHHHHRHHHHHHMMMKKPMMKSSDAPADAPK
jgi:hypothetical protein